MAVDSRVSSPVARSRGRLASNRLEASDPRRRVQMYPPNQGKLLHDKRAEPPVVGGKRGGEAAGALVDN